MKKILVLFVLILVSNVYAQVPAKQVCKSNANCTTFTKPATDINTPPSAAVNFKPVFPASLKPDMILTLNLSESQKTDQTPRILRITLDDEKEYTFQYTNQNVWSGRAIYKNPNKNGFSIVIKPLEPLTALNYRPN